MVIGHGIYRLPGQNIPVTRAEFRAGNPVRRIDDWVLAALAAAVILPPLIDWKTKNAADALVNNIK